MYRRFRQTSPPLGPTFPRRAGSKGRDKGCLVAGSPSSFGCPRYIAVLLWRSSRGRPLNAPAVNFLNGALPACIGETGIGKRTTPRRIHCGLPTQALLFSHSGGGLQHQHLVRCDREAANLILWGLLGDSRARSTEDEHCCGQGCGEHNQIFLFHVRPHFGTSIFLTYKERSRQ
jgi:hypothetical protein